MVVEVVVAAALVYVRQRENLGGGQLHSWHLGEKLGMSTLQKRSSGKKEIKSEPVLDDHTIEISYVQLHMATSAFHSFGSMYEVLVQTTISASLNLQQNIKHFLVAIQ